MQTCTVCKQTLNPDNFYKNPKKKSGSSNVCKKCSLAAVKKHNHSPEGKAKDAARRAVLKQKRIESGLCVKCDRIRLDKCFQCDFHCVQDAAKWGLGRCDNQTVNTLLQRFHANPTCPYTGELLRLGFNAHLDHVQPRHRFPELASDINNVEWVSEKANLAKSGLTKDEFINLCQQITKLCGGASRGV